MAIRTSKRDNNYYSIANNIPSRTDIGLPVLLPDKPQQFDAILKVSNQTSNYTKSDVKIAQGKENSVDVNGGITNLVLQGEFGVGGGEGDQVITAKGGSRMLVFRGEVKSKGRFCDVFIGSWSDESYKKTEGLVLDLKAEGRKVTIVVGRATLPDWYNKETMEILFWKSVGAKIYWWTKYFYVKLLVSNIKFLQKS